MLITKKIKLNIFFAILGFLILGGVLIYTIDQIVVENNEATIVKKIVISVTERIALRTEYLANYDNKSKEQWLAKNREITDLIGSNFDSEDRVLVDRVKKENDLVESNFSALVKNHENSFSVRVESILIGQLSLNVNNEFVEIFTLYDFIRTQRTNVQMVGVLSIFVLTLFLFLDLIFLTVFLRKEEKIDETKNEFLILASHQLRTPPTIIKWYTESLLSNQQNFDEKQRSYLQEIYNGNTKMIDLIDSFLDVSKIELGSFKIEPEPLQVTDSVTTILSEYQKEIKEKKLKIEQLYEENLPTLNADPNFLTIIIENLISNAIKYTLPEGKITIEIKTKNKNMIFRVSDTGIGIPKHQKEKIFTRFFRADNANDCAPNGTGLGLFITKSIVEQVGGKIRFESTENKGTDFYVLFPKEGMKNRKGGDF